MSKNKKNAKSPSMTKRTQILITLILLLLAPLVITAIQQRPQTKQQAAENALYVSSSGSDSNNGSQSSPFATINKAASAATAGTTIHVAPGTYQPVVNNKSGTSGSPIKFVSDTKWGAKIVGSGNGSTKNYLFRNNGSYVHIIGFDMTGKGVTNGVDNFGSNNLVQGNHVHDMTNINCSGSPGGSGIGDDTGSNNTYDGNVVHHIGDYPTKCDYVHAIYVDDPGDIVSNNISYNNVGNGLYTNHGTSGAVTFVNNLSFANLEYGVGVNGSLSGSVVANNILVGNGIAAAKTWSSASNTQFINNIMFSNPTNIIKDGSITEQGTITSDPQLVNYQSNGSGDYHLKTGSPAIDKGTATKAPTTDIEGKPRPQGAAVDIGPYEVGGAGAVTPSSSQQPSPTNITPTFVCGGSQNCVGTPSPTIYGGNNNSPSPSGGENLTPTGALSGNPTQPETSPTDGNAPSTEPSTGGDANSILKQLLDLLEKLIKYLQQILGNSGSRRHHHHHH
jgi:hypothetical protein